MVDMPKQLQFVGWMVVWFRYGGSTLQHFSFYKNDKSKTDITCDVVGEF